MATRRTRSLNPAIPTGEVIADFTKYQDAVEFVDRLVANEFPAQLVSIIGSDLRTVEQLRGKLGYGRIALSGLITGSWVGLLFGLLFGSSDPTEAALASNIGAGIVIGAGVGMLLNVIRFSLAKSKRTFISTSQVVANRYDVLVPAEQSEQAKKASLVKAPVKKSSAS